MAIGVWAQAWRQLAEQAAVERRLHEIASSHAQAVMTLSAFQGWRELAAARRLFPREAARPMSRL
jgi:hypothetical protein